MIPFYKPTYVGTELQYIKYAIKNFKTLNKKYFIKQCEQWMEHHFKCKKILLTPSCSASLEMAAILINIKPGDEVIMPSFTFPSTANAFALRGAKIIFIDIKPDTMNIDEDKIEFAITKNTRAIVPVHYAGIACNMDKIVKIAKKYQLFVIEDAAQAVMALYNNAALGTFGDIGCYSFHETKNYTSGGEGGAILINNSDLINKAEIIREKGTNRNKFLLKQTDKYTWINIGSNYSMSELQAAYLWAQLQQIKQINNVRLNLWNNYYQLFYKISKIHNITIPNVPQYSTHNAHTFYIKFNDIKTRIQFHEYLKIHQITATAHYVALHSSKAGKIFSTFHGKDIYTTKNSNLLTRLPLFYNLTLKEQKYIIKKITLFFDRHINKQIIL
uniref:dTDP-4-amino-4,6-dideoxygalactose transaminase n=1 Tax=Candidatus Aschnera chinzeii TaxID=1485666 RepID=A0AAT9G4T7_9ENTR|nr:MAG: dTDP-4-amino-4,6-dideoxygalactose transaminase [Candidatus Aschnera chinzeii]